MTNAENASNVPDGYVMNKVLEYEKICRDTHPDSPQAQQFLAEHEHLPRFKENAVQHYNMLKEGLASLEQKFGKPAE